MELNAPIGRFRPIWAINRRVLRRYMHSSWISIKLTCIETDPLVSLEFFLFLFQFRIHGGVVADSNMFIFALVQQSNEYNMNRDIHKDILVRMLVCPKNN